YYLEGLFPRYSFRSLAFAKRTTRPNFDHEVFQMRHQLGARNINGNRVSSEAERDRFMQCRKAMLNTPHFFSSSYAVFHQSVKLS
nr:hypothetical protein [Tanacetum cinerariifolium]